MAQELEEQIVDKRRFTRATNPGDSDEFIQRNITSMSFKLFSLAPTTLRVNPLPLRLRAGTWIRRRPLRYEPVDES